MQPAASAATAPNWQEQDGILREMWLANQPPPAIAEALGRSIAAIMTRAARLGLPRRFAPGRKPGRRLPAEHRPVPHTARAPAEPAADNLPQTSTRICLMCLGKFQSLGRHNRICSTCKNSSEYESASRLPDLNFPVD